MYLILSLEILAPLGIPNYGTREIAKVRDDKIKERHLFSELFTINAVSTLICSICYILLVFLNSRFASDFKLYIVAGLPILFNFINVDWYYQGNEKYKYIAKRSFIVKIISLALIFLFVRSQQDYLIYALIYGLGIGLNNIFNIYHLLCNGMRLEKVDAGLRRHFKPIIVLLCTTIAIELYTLIDTTMLGIMCSDEIVGYYTNSMKLVKVLITVISAIGGVLLPRLSYYREHEDIDACNKLISSVTQIMLFLFVPCGIGIFVMADRIVPVLFGSTFMPAITTMRIASFLIYVLGFSNLFGTQVLLTFDGERQLLICTITGAVSNIIMNSIMIPYYAQNGAALASVLSETLVTALTIVFSMKYISLKLNVSNIIKTIISAIVMGLVICVMNNKISPNFVSLVLCIIAGVFVYALVNQVEKNEIMDTVFSIVFRKRRNTIKP